MWGECVGERAAEEEEEKEAEGVEIEQQKLLKRMWRTTTTTGNLTNQDEQRPVIIAIVTPCMHLEVAADGCEQPRSNPAHTIAVEPIV